MKNIVSIMVFFFILLFSTGCSDKASNEFNKPALFWYKNMLKSISANDTEGADNYFTSLQSEHVNSPLLPEAMLILAKAHMDSEEYLLATFYLDEYIKRFGTNENIDFVKQLKIKANFYAFRISGRDQQLLIDSIKDAQSFLDEYPYSRYRPFVDTMLIKMYLADYSLNRDIANLYEKLDKPEAAKIYRDRAKYEWLKEIVAKEPQLAWYRKIFDW